MDRLPGRIETQIKEARQYVEGRPVKVSSRPASGLGALRTPLGIKRDRQGIIRRRESRRMRTSPRYGWGIRDYAEPAAACAHGPGNLVQRNQPAALRRIK